MKNIELIDKLESSENISKILNSQWKNVQNDILFLKDDILKDFRQIETKLNNKYEKQNLSTLNKLEKFEKTIEVMNQKITNLSSLISTDKNIQQKVSQLYEFKTKTEDDYLNHDISIKNMAKEFRDAINNYDKIMHDSIIYPGIIGYNGKFTTFHDLIDYVLKNISQLATFRDKNVLDFKSYKAKIESLIKSFKMQANSIISNTTEYVNKKNEDLEQKIKEVMNSQEAKIFELRLENNKLGLALENKIDKLNTERKKMLNIKEEIYKKFDEEVFLLKDFNKILVSKFENYQNEFKLIKNRFTTLSDFIKDVRFRINMGELKKKDMKSMSDKIDFTKRQRLSNASSQFIRNGVLAKSIIKRYIAGELGLIDFTHPLKTHKSIVAAGYDFRKKLFNNYKSNSNQSSSLNKLNKRMTLSPDNLLSLKKLHKSFTNVNISINDNNTIYSDKSDDNCINEEKDEDIDYINDYKNKLEKKEDDKSKTEKIEKDQNQDKQKINLDFTNLYEDIEKDKNDTIKINNSNKEDSNNDNNLKKKGIIISLINNNKRNNSNKEDDKNNIIQKNDKEVNIRTIVPKNDKEKNIRAIISKNDKEENIKTIIPKNDKEGNIRTIISKNDKEENIKTIIPKNDKEENIRTIISKNDKEENIKTIISKNDKEENIRTIISKNDKEENIKTIISKNDKEENIKTIISKNDKEENIKTIISKNDKEENIRTLTQKNDKEENIRTIPYEKSNINNNSFPKIINHTKEKENTYLKNQKLFSIKYKLNKIDDNVNNLSLIYKNRYNKTNFEPNNYDLNNSYNYGPIRKNINGSKLNIVEMNFDENNSLAKEKAQIKKIINDIREEKMNLVIKKNNDKLDEKHLIFRKLKKNNSQASIDNKSMGKIVINNDIRNNYYYNMMAKEDLHNYSSLGYLNYIQKNKVALNQKKISIKKKKGIHSNLEE